VRSSHINYIPYHNALAVWLVVTYIGKEKKSKVEWKREYKKGGVLFSSSILPFQTRLRLSEKPLTKFLLTMTK